MNGFVSRSTRTLHPAKQWIINTGYWTDMKVWQLGERRARSKRQSKYGVGKVERGEMSVGATRLSELNRFQRWKRRKGLRGAGGDHRTGGMHGA